MHEANDRIFATVLAVWKELNSGTGDHDVPGVVDFVQHAVRAFANGMQDTVIPATSNWDSTSHSQEHEMFNVKECKENEQQDMSSKLSQNRISQRLLDNISTLLRGKSRTRNNSTHDVLDVRLPDLKSTTDSNNQQISPSPSNISPSVPCTHTHQSNGGSLTVARTTLSLPSNLTDYCTSYYNGRNSLTSSQQCPTETDSYEYFNFLGLPVEVQTKIVSMLPPRDRGMLGILCRDLKEVVKQPCLWTTVDLCAIQFCNKSDNHEGAKACSTAYKARLRSFITFIQSIGPNIKQLRFSLDIYESNSTWLNKLQSMIHECKTKDLEVAHLDWENNSYHTIDTSRKNNDVCYAKKCRTRKFMNFFRAFTDASPNISTLMMPFDWQDKSIEYLAKLTKLKILVLHKYFENVKPESVEKVLNCLPELEKFIIEVQGGGIRMYDMQHAKLKYLDISRCRRGFCLKSIDMPVLTEFRTSRCAWDFGPFGCGTSEHGVPCLYNVLQHGAPNLQQINDHRLHDDWRVNIYPELESLLKSVCSCPMHKEDWHKALAQ